MVGRLPPGHSVLAVEAPDPEVEIAGIRDPQQVGNQQHRRDWREPMEHDDVEEDGQPEDHDFCEGHAGQARTEEDSRPRHVQGELTRRTAAAPSRHRASRSRATPARRRWPSGCRGRTRPGRRRISAECPAACAGAGYHSRTPRAVRNDARLAPPRQMKRNRMSISHGFASTTRSSLVSCLNSRQAVRRSSRWSARSCRSWRAVTADDGLRRPAPSASVWPISGCSLPCSIQGCMTFRQSFISAVIVGEDAQPQAVRAQAARHHGSDVELLALAGGGAVDDDPAEFAAAAQALGGVLAAEHFENRVDAFAVGELVDAHFVIDFA